MSSPNIDPGILDLRINNPPQIPMQRRAKPAKPSPKLKRFGNWIKEKSSHVLTAGCVTLLICMIFVPSMLTTTRKFSVLEPNDWSDFARHLVSLLESVGASTGGMSPLITEKWPLGKTDYYVGPWVLCRKSENSPTKCTFNNRYYKGIIVDMGKVFAEERSTSALKRKPLAKQWEDSYYNALRQTTSQRLIVVEISRSFVSMSEELLNTTHGPKGAANLFGGKMMPFFLLGFAIGSFISLLCDAKGVSALCRLLTLLLTAPIILGFGFGGYAKVGILEMTSSCGGYFSLLIVNAVIQSALNW